MGVVSSQLAEPLRSRDAEPPAEEPRSSCSRTVLIPMGIYYFVTLAATLALCSLAGFEYPNKFQSKMRKAAYLYTLPYEILAVIAAMLASANACGHMCQHLRRNPNDWTIKRCTLVILSMVPIYAVCSAAALVGSMNELQFSPLLSAFREFYEAFVLIAFMQFIAEFFGGTVKLAGALDKDDMVMGTVFPHIVDRLDRRLSGLLGVKLADIRVFPVRRAPGSEYVAWTYVGALQYAFVMTLFGVAHAVMWKLRGTLDNGIHERCEIALKGMKGLSNLWAMYNLLILFECLRENAVTSVRMNRIRPISKFVCIKLIVIFSLWQEAIITFLAKMGKLPTLQGWNMKWSDQQANAQAIVDFLVCLEMLLFAQWHRYAYPFDEDWSLSDRVVSHYKPKCPLLNSGVCKMMDDVGYLLWRRVRNQHKCVRELARLAKQRQLAKQHRGKRHTSLSVWMHRVTGYDVTMEEAIIEAEVKRLWRYFERDANDEVSHAQLVHVLVQSHFARNMQDARDKLEHADEDKNQRLSYEEFRDRLHLEH